MPKLQFSRWLSHVMLVIGTFLIAPVVLAQEDSIPIQYGDIVSGVITEGVPCQYYRFEGNTGDFITLDMRRTSGSLDGVMALYWQDDFTRAPISNNDDRPGGGLDPLIEHTLPETTFYTVAACRLQADRMRVTTGEYTLTLIGPGDDVPASATPAPPDTASESGDTGDMEPAAPLGGLSDSIFGSNATATPETSLTEALFGGPETLTDGSVVTGELAADADSVTYRLSVVAGDAVLIEWLRMSGNFAPHLRVTDANGRVLALTSTPDAVSALSLALLAPGDGTLTITIARHGSVIGAPVVDGTAGVFTLGVGVFP